MLQEVEPQLVGRVELEGLAVALDDMDAKMIVQVQDPMGPTDPTAVELLLGVGTTPRRKRAGRF